MSEMEHEDDNIDAEWPYEEEALSLAFEALAKQLEASWRCEMRRVLGSQEEKEPWNEYWVPRGSPLADFPRSSWDEAAFATDGAGRAVLDAVGLKAEGPFEEYLHETRPFLDVIAAVHTFRLLEAKKSHPMTDTVLLAKMSTVEYSHAFCTLVMDFRWQLSLCNREYAEHKYEDAEEYIMREAASRLDLCVGPGKSWQSTKWGRELAKRLGLARSMHRAVTDRSSSSDAVGGVLGEALSGSSLPLLLRLGQPLLARVLTFLDAKAASCLSATCKPLAALVMAELRPEPNPALSAARAALQKAIRNSAEEDFYGRPSGWLGFEGSSELSTPDQSTVRHLDGSRPIATTLGISNQGGMMESMLEMLRGSGLFGMLMAGQPEGFDPRQRLEQAVPKSELAPKPTPSSSKLARFSAQALPDGHAASSDAPGVCPGGVAAAVRDGVFDVQHFYRFCSSATVGMAGDVMAVCRGGGYKYRQLTLDALVLHGGDAANDEDGPECSNALIKHDFNSIQELHVDAPSGMIWCAGQRNKGPSLIAGFSTKALPQRGSATESTLRHLLQPVIGKSRAHKVVGMCSAENSLYAVTSNGEVHTWDLSASAELVPQGGEGTLLDYSDVEEEEEEGWSDEDEAPAEEATPEAKAPQHSQLLQLPRNVRRLRKAVAVLSGRAPATLVATHSPKHDLLCHDDGQELLMYDWETRRLRHQCFGHQLPISDICVSPSSSAMGPLLATASLDCTVKIWDMRSPLPVISLTNAGSHDSPSCCCFADFSQEGVHGTALSSAGSILFTGWGQGILAWDLRASSAHAMYEMATGNTEPDNMVWHASSGSLLVNVSLSGVNRFGEVYRQDFRLVPGPGGHDDDPQYWPKHARHRPNDFEQVWSQYSGEFLAYRFTHKGWSASHGGESSVGHDEPYFAGEW